MKKLLFFSLFFGFSLSFAARNNQPVWMPVDEAIRVFMKGVIPEEGYEGMKEELKNNIRPDGMIDASLVQRRADEIRRARAIIREYEADQAEQPMQVEQPVHVEEFPMEMDIKEDNAQ